MNKKQKMVSNAAAAAQKAEEESRNGGDSAMSAYMRSRNMGYRPAPRNNAEAWGRVAQQYLIPLIAQGINAWKENYDARGDFKQAGADYLDRMLRGEPLTQGQQHTLDVYQRERPELYNQALEAARQRLGMADPQAQATGEGAVNNDAARQSLLGAITQPQQQQVPADFSFGAPDMQGSLANQFGQSDLDSILSGMQQQRAFFPWR